MKFSYDINKQIREEYAESIFQLLKKRKVKLPDPPAGYYYHLDCVGTNGCKASVETLKKS